MQHFDLQYMYRRMTWENQHVKMWKESEVVCLGVQSQNKVRGYSERLA